MLNWPIQEHWMQCQKWNYKKRQMEMIWDRPCPNSLQFHRLSQRYILCLNTVQILSKFQLSYISGLSSHCNFELKINLDKDWKIKQAGVDNTGYNHPLQSPVKDGKFGKYYYGYKTLDLWLRTYLTYDWVERTWNVCFGQKYYVCALNHPRSGMFFWVGHNVPIFFAGQNDACRPLI